MLNKVEKPIAVFILDEDPDNRHLTHLDFEAIEWVSQVRIFSWSLDLLQHLDGLSGPAFGPALIIFNNDIQMMTGKEFLFRLLEHPHCRQTKFGIYDSGLREGDELWIQSTGITLLKRPVDLEDGRRLALQIRDTALKETRHSKC
ncbi:hypothetical protein [Flaviaesturariibacter amylovorans]|uniref:Uncharacterized protein n=1 Tax=Flaviaesturariibacter amylovorans TaxID=1084520 RepID=A0ABP8H4Z0_9BACT